MHKIKEFYILVEFGSNEVQWTKEEETTHLQQICVGYANDKLHKQPTFSTSTNGSQFKITLLINQDLKSLSTCSFQI